MLAHFAISQRGEGHKARGIECQDFSLTKEIHDKELKRSFVIAAIADGVGSADFSAIGAETAVNSVVECVVHNLSGVVLTNDSGMMLDLLRHSFNWARQAVMRRADNDELPFVLFDSTLTIAVYDGKTVWFGHIGDDGIVAMYEDGNCKLVTTRHKGESVNELMPLRAERYWEFGVVENVASFVLMTDGMLNYCVDNEMMNNRVYLPFLYPLLYKALSTQEEVDTYRNEWEEYLLKSDNDNIRAQKTSTAEGLGQSGAGSGGDEGDEIKLRLGRHDLVVKVEKVVPFASKEGASQMYTLISDTVVVQ